LNNARLFKALFSGANLSKAKLNDAALQSVNFVQANLNCADLNGADLMDAKLANANLTGANLSEANLAGADLEGARVVGANLAGAYLFNASLIGADLRGVNLTGARLGKTILADVNLSNVIGLETCEHSGPSIIDHKTILKSASLPLVFLRGIGLPDALIDYFPSLLNPAIQHYSCFISYSTRDQEFAERLHADLQNNSVRCWFAPHDMPIGSRILDEIDAAIRQRDKVLLILSEHSIASNWVEDEVTKAFEEERKRGRTVLFPIRLDDAVMHTGEAWAGKLRNQRHIGDFQHWKDFEAYKKSFARVLRDLAVQVDGD
jgi:hypothetical protein